MLPLGEARMDLIKFMYEISHKGKKNVFDELSRAFPVSMCSDVYEVTSLLTAVDAKIYENRNIYINGLCETYYLTSDVVALPYQRCCFKPLNDHQYETLSDLHRKIYACISLLNHDGYYREKQLRYLLEQSMEEWVLPFLLKVSSEYVKEILAVIFEVRMDKDNTQLKEFCKKNPRQAQRSYSRMTSYWGEYYRWDPNPCIIDRRQGYRTFIRNYVGYRLFRECWGVSPRRRS